MPKIVKSLGQIDKKYGKADLIELAKEHAEIIVASDKYDLLKVYIEFKRYEVYLKTLIEEVKAATFEQAKEEGQRDFEYANARITFTNRRKYDYSVDNEWKDINDEIDRLKQLKKQRESMLKSIKGDYKEVVDEATGEIQKIFAPLLEYMETLQVKL